MIIITGCGGGSGGESASSSLSDLQPSEPYMPSQPTTDITSPSQETQPSEPTATPQEPAPVETIVTITGAGVDDYIIGGKVKAFKLDGTEVEFLEPCYTGPLGIFECKAKNITEDTPIVIVVEGGKLDKDGDPNTVSDARNFEGALTALSKASTPVVANPVTSKIIAEVLNLSLVVKPDVVYIPSAEVEKIKNRVLNISPVVDDLIKKQDIVLPAIISNSNNVDEVVKVVAETLTDLRNSWKLDDVVSSIVVNKDQTGTISVKVLDSNIEREILDLQLKKSKEILKKIKEENEKRKVLKEILESITDNDSEVEDDVDNVLIAIEGGQQTQLQQILDNILQLLPVEVEEKPTEEIEEEQPGEEETTIPAIPSVEEGQSGEEETPVPITIPSVGGGATSGTNQAVSSQYSPNAPKPTNGWYEEILNFDGKNFAKFTITIPAEKSYYIVAEFSGNELFQSEIDISNITYIDGTSASKDITPITPETTESSIAKIKITNNSSFDKTYVIPIAARKNGKYIPAKIWVAAISAKPEEVSNPKSGGSILLGNTDGNVGEMLIEGKKHIWTFQIDENSAGTYKLVVDANVDNYKNPLWYFTVVLKDTTNKIYVDEINGYTESGYKEIVINNLPSGKYYLIIKGESTKPDALGYYLIKLIKLN